MDRSVPPPIGEPRPPRVPPLVMRTLTNGARVAVIEDYRIPAVQVRVIFDRSPGAEPIGKEGIATLMSSMLAEGTTLRTADEIAEAVAELGNSVTHSAFLTILPRVDQSLGIMAEQLLAPAFPQASLDRLKAATITALRRQQALPQAMARRVFANVVFGAGHPYARASTEATIASITRDDLVAFHDEWYRPANATFIVTGALSPGDAVERLERSFGHWKAGGSRAAHDVPVPAGPGATAIYLLDRPGAQESEIMVGHLGPPVDAPDHLATQLMNTVLGGSFSSRLNQKLRVEHGFTYGAGSAFSSRPAPQPGTFVSSMSVQAPRTGSALSALMRELQDIRGTRPVTREEFEAARSSAANRIPLAFETLEKRSAGALSVILDRLPSDHMRTLGDRYSRVTLEEVNESARRHIDPGHLAIVIVGDRAAIEPGLRASGIAPIVIVDEEGRPVRTP